MDDSDGYHRGKRIDRLAPDRLLRLKKWGESLEKRIVAADLNALQFAARCEVQMKSKKFGRDLISNYVNGKSQPSNLHEAAMAKVLGITVEELMAPIATGTIHNNDGLSAPFDLQSVGGDRAWLRINMELPMIVAVQILTLLPQAAGK
jgi:transcriptional regulator with XRE-family HTH domain